MGVDGHLEWKNWLVVLGSNDGFNDQTSYLTLPLLYMPTLRHPCVRLERKRLESTRTPKKCFLVLEIHCTELLSPEMRLWYLWEPVSHPESSLWSHTGCSFYADYTYSAYGTCTVRATTALMIYGAREVRFVSSPGTPKSQKNKGKNYIYSTRHLMIKK